MLYVIILCIIIQKITFSFTFITVYLHFYPI